MPKRAVNISIILLFISNCLLAQKDVPVPALDSITVSSYLRGTTKQHLPDVDGTYIFAGKQNIYYSVWNKVLSL